MTIPRACFFVFRFTPTKRFYKGKCNKKINTYPNFVAGEGFVSSLSLRR